MAPLVPIWPPDQFCLTLASSVPRTEMAQQIGSCTDFIFFLGYQNLVSHGWYFSQFFSSFSPCKQSMWHRLWNTSAGWLKIRILFVEYLAFFIALGVFELSSLTLQSIFCVWSSFLSNFLQKLEQCFFQNAPTLLQSWLFQESSLQLSHFELG